MSDDARCIALYVPKLIRLLLGHNEEEKTYRTCEQTAWHSIRNRRYVGTNSHNVRRAIDDLVERFSLESMAEFGVTFRYLCTSLLELPKWEDHHAVDVQWSIIDLLLTMTQSPIQNVRRNRLEMNRKRILIHNSLDLEHAKRVNESKEESLQIPDDLLALLREDFLDVPTYSSDTDNDSDDSLSDRPKCSDSKGSGQAQLVALSRRTSRRLLPELPVLKSPMPAMRHVPSTYEAIKLEERVHSYWWQEGLQVYAQQDSGNVLSNFAIAYVQFQRRQVCHLRDYPLPKTTTERCLMREIVSMFFKPASCCFFEFRQRRISVRDNVSISSVTSQGLKAFLEQSVLPPMQAMYELRRIVAERTQTSIGMPSTWTLESFGAALRDLIQPLIVQLVAFQRRLINDESDPCSLLHFVHCMGKEFQQLQALHAIAQNAVIDAERAPPHVRSAHLLASLHAQMHAQPKQQKPIAVLLLCALRMYLSIIDSWWRRGHLEDWHHEFIVERGAQPENGGGSVRVRTLDPQDAQIANQIEQCPLYRVLCDYALETGHTLDMLTHFNRLLQMTDGSDAPGERPLHDELIAQLCNELSNFHDRADIGPPMQRQQEPHQQQRPEIPKELAIIRDQELLSILLSESVDEQPQPQPQTQYTAAELLAHLYKCLPGPISMQDLFVRCLVRTLEQRRLLVNAYVIRLFREEVQVSAHVRFLRHMLLLEADYLLYPFYTRLFRRIESGEPWSRASLLTMKLYDIIGEHYAPMAERLEFKLRSQLHASTKRVYEAIDDIELTYDMQPALRLIISDASMTLYNSIFRLLIKVKWAAWKLENLKLMRRRKRDPYAPLDLLALTVRRLEILRFWLIYLVNSLHTHLCTHVLQSLGMEFKQRLDECSNMRDLIDMHGEYVELLAKHCMLTPPFKNFRLALHQLFHLVYVVAIEWNSCVTYMQHETQALSAESSDALEYLALNQVAEIEMTYIRCHQMLGTTLNKLVYRQGLTFLTGLEVAISTSLPY